MIAFTSILPRAAVRTRALTSGEAQRYIEALRDSTMVCDPLDQVVIDRARQLPSLNAFEMAELESTAPTYPVRFHVELAHLGRPRRPTRERSLSVDQVEHAFAFTERIAKVSPDVRFSPMVALPTTPPFDPAGYGDAEFSLGRSSNIRIPAPDAAPHRFNYFKGRLAIRLDNRDPRSGAELAADYNRTLAALGVGESVRVGVDENGNSSLQGLDPETLYCIRRGGQTWVGGERVWSGRPDLDALERGQRVISPSHGSGGEIASISIEDPSAPFTLDDAQRVLDVWGGRVYDIWISGGLTSEHYNNLRDEFDHDGDPFGCWEVWLWSRRVKNLAALEVIPGRCGNEFGIGTTVTEAGAEVYLTLLRKKGHYRIQAHARGSKADAAAALSRAIGDPKAVEHPSPSSQAS